MNARTPDALDLKLLQALQFDGRAPFSRIAQVLDVSEQTIARRFRRLHVTAGLRVLGVTDATKLGRSRWIVRLRCTPDVAERLAEGLAKRPDTAHVVLISGGTEVMCAMKPRSRQERDELLFDRLPRTPRVTSVNAHCVLHSFYGGPLGWLTKISALTPEEEAALRPMAGEPTTESVSLDPDDERLLAVLQRDGRATLTELQSATSLTESVVKRRLENLKATGVLYFDIEHDHEPLGHDVEAMLWLTVAPSRLAQVGHALAAHPEVRFAAATTGQANMVISTLHPTVGDLYTYLSKRVGALDGVQSVETALALRHVKRLTYEPPRTRPGQ
ncbi:Lrp/AsnC family transcriptional regulator [Streptomyces sp. NPDC050509]|uniref:Lrp/AsnC family transcriptional regulator n=1 Tax=Streptomyces sp. NPDC050509 TaxID=3365620 RepID=UPI0037979574